jgi:hypothetical protein
VKRLPLGAKGYQMKVNEGKIIRCLNEANNILETAHTEEQFQSIGLLCREILTTLAQDVFNPKIHLSENEEIPSKTNAKRMVEKFIQKELNGKTNENSRKFAKSALDLANELVHDRTANIRDASLCLEATMAVIRVIGVISNNNYLGQPNNVF